MSASEAKKYRSKMRKQQMREEQEKQKQLEAERRKKEFQRSRNKEDAEEDKMKEEEIVAEKLERVIESTSPLTIIVFVLVPVRKTVGRSDALFTTVGRFFWEFLRHAFSRL